MSEKEEKSEKLADEFDMIQGDEDKSYDFANHLAKIEDLPDLGQIELYDYDTDLVVSTQKGLEVLESLVDLYLGEFPELKNHPYIREKMKEDAMVYAETLFLSKMTRKNFLTQLRQVDNGDNSARMHEVVNQTIGQVRENISFASTQRNELEKFYKEFRLDLIEVTENNKILTPTKEDKDTGIVDNKHLNDLINDALKKKKKE